MIARYEFDKKSRLDGWKRRVSVSHLTLLLFVSGCATGVSQGGITSVTPGTSRLVVYRPTSFVGMAISPKIVVNGVDSCRISNGQAFIKDVTPGPVTITSGLMATPGTSRLSFSAAGGQTYYVRFTMNTGETLAGAFGGFVGQAIEQSVSHSGPFDMELTDQGEMGNIIPGICGD